MKRISWTSFIGLSLGLFFVIQGIIESHSAKLFWNLPSFLVIIGGTTASLIYSYPGAYLKTLGVVIAKGFTAQKLDYSKDIQNIVEISILARKNGVLSLENVAKEYDDDPFFQKGVQMIADGFSKDALMKQLKSEIYYMKQRHAIGIDMVDMIAGTVTSLGLMGTYIGLIPMLNHLDDPAALGPLMSLELVSSFYGCFISYVVFSPLVRRLKGMDKAEVLRNTLIMDGLCEVLEGKNPKLIEELLSVSLTKKQLRKRQINGESGIDTSSERLA
jgi:chemotaxis protein MotA